MTIIYCVYIHANVATYDIWHDMACLYFFPFLWSSHKIFSPLLKVHFEEKKKVLRKNRNEGESCIFFIFYIWIKWLERKNMLFKMRGFAKCALIHWIFSGYFLRVFPASEHILIFFTIGIKEDWCEWDSLSTDDTEGFNVPLLERQGPSTDDNFHSLTTHTVNATGAPTMCKCYGVVIYKII